MSQILLPTKKRTIENLWTDQKFLMIGQGGIGKSEFWSHGERTLFLECEPGLNHLEVMSVPIRSWSDFIEVGKQLTLALDSDEFPYDTIVIDTVDQWVALANELVVSEARNRFKKIASEINSVGDVPNGSGWFQATNLIGTYLRKLSSLPCAVVLIGHYRQRTIKEGTREYDKSTISIGGQMGEQILHWSDHTLFLEGKMYGDTMKRIVHTLPNQIREAKSRGKIIPDGWEWGEDSAENYERLRKAFN